MRKIGVQILFFCLVCSTGLVAQQRDDAYFNQIADEICDCTSEMGRYYQQILELQKNGGSEEEMIALSQKMESSTGDFEKCIDQLEKKYPDIDGNKDFEKRAEKALAERCQIFNTMNALQNAENDSGIEAPLDKSDAYFNDAANDICDCSSDLDKYTNKFQEIYKNGETNDEAQLQALAAQIDEISKDFEVCIKNAMKKYPEIEGNKTYEAKTEQVLAETCPFFEGMNEEEEAIEHADRAEIEGLELEDHDINEDEEYAIEDTTPINKEYQNFATDVCDCIGQEPALMSDFQAVKAKGNAEELNTFRRQIQNNYPTVMNCFETIVKTYPNIGAYDHSGEKKKAALLEYCPSYLDILGAR